MPGASSCSVAVIPWGLLCNNLGECEGDSHIHLKVTFTLTLRKQLSLRMQARGWAPHLVCAGPSVSASSRGLPLGARSARTRDEWTQQCLQQDVDELGGSQAKEVGTWGAARPALSEGRPHDTLSFPLQTLAPGHSPSCPIHRTAPRPRCPKGTLGREAGQVGGCSCWWQASSCLGAEPGTQATSPLPAHASNQASEFSEGPVSFIQYSGLWSPPLGTSSGDPRTKSRRSPWRTWGALSLQMEREHGESWGPCRARVVNPQALPRASSLTPQNFQDRQDTEQDYPLRQTQRFQRLQGERETPDLPTTGDQQGQDGSKAQVGGCVGSRIHPGAGILPAGAPSTPPECLLHHFTLSHPWMTTQEWTAGMSLSEKPQFLMLENLCTFFFL